MSPHAIRGSFIAAAALVLPAYAVPQPLSEEKLWESADAVVVVDVVSVTRTAKEAIQGEPVYLVRMRVREVRKGDVRVGHIFAWEMANYEPAPGEYGGRVAYPGEQFLYYLERYPNGTYGTLDGESVILREVPLEKQRIPQHLGQTVYAPGYGPEDVNRAGDCARVARGTLNCRCRAGKRWFRRCGRRRLCRTCGF